MVVIIFNNACNLSSEYFAVDSDPEIGRIIVFSFNFNLMAKVVIFQTINKRIRTD